VLVAELPWYDFVELRAHTDTWWQGIARHLCAAGVDGIPDALVRGADYESRWRDPQLLLSQACGYDVLYDAADHIVPIATPCYAAEGCEGPRYRSFVVVRTDRAWQSFQDLRGRSLAINQVSSHSGSNALRPQAAALQREGAFFGDVVESGSHMLSLLALHRGEVDVACIDAVVLAILRRNRPEAVMNLRAVACTNTALAPPYVASKHASAQLHTQLRAALQAAIVDPELAAAREALLLRDIAFFPPASYSELEEFEQAAIAVGYDELPAPMRSPLSDREA
jgi:ABC-type phosphate/phosphonate transport system substrate-binding protein